MLNKDQTMRNKIYELVDGFLVEAKDQNGNERSLERLNQDRHLFVDNLSAQYEKLIEEVMPEEETSRIFLQCYKEGFNECRNLIRTSLQERGINIK